MFKPSSIIHHHKYDNSNNNLSKEFGLITWNAQKKNNLITFKTYLSGIQKQYATNLILLQEAKKLDKESHILNDFDKIYSANIEIKKHSFGLLTASSSVHSTAKNILSHHKEPFIKTHKNILISSYQSYNNKEILIVNVHAINFKSTKAYIHEIETLVYFLAKYQGALIIAGDFNTWNKKRNLILLNNFKKLNLQKALLLNERYIKKFRQFPLDHIFYRNLKLIKAEAINCNKISDHNPLYSLFKTI